MSGRGEQGSSLWFVWPSFFAVLYAGALLTQPDFIWTLLDKDDRKEHNETLKCKKVKIWSRMLHAAIVAFVGVVGAYIIHAYLFGSRQYLQKYSMNINRTLG